MPTMKKKESGSGETRVTIPPKLLELFAKEPRVVIKHRPDGLMPIDEILLNHPELLQKLVATPEFQNEFEVIIMRR